MRVVIFGATGLLGNALTRQWRHDEVIGLGSGDADIRSPQQVEAVLARYRPDWIVLAAAYTDVDGCETHRDLAFEVNCAGAASVARAAAQIGSKLIFLSTDYVFDGSKNRPYETDDPVSPQSVYGQTKAAAETEILKIAPQACILRTSWVFGIGGKCFPDTILRLAGSRETLEVVDDQRGCPTYTVDLARTIIELCRKDAAGILHATDSGDCTWFKFATAIVSGAGLKTKILATTTDHFSRPAPRPKYSVLSLSRLQLYGISMPSWQDALARYLKEREDQSRSS
jgi:dTDP-4-dehydrorhamnose reductase